MRATKRAFFIWAFLIGAYLSSAQTNPFFSQYMLNPATYNPGWLGDVTTAFGAVQHRSQWAGYNSTFDGSGGAPTSQAFSFIIPVKGVINSAGTVISLDQQGIESTLKIQFGGAYNITNEKGIISFGLMPSVLSRSLDFSQFRFETPGDPFDTGNKETQGSLDLAAGIFFRSYSGLFAGVSMDHILSPALIKVESGGQKIEGRLQPIYYFHGGNKFTINRDLDITPSLIVRTDLDGFTLDVSGMATYRNTMWGGLSVRRSEAIVLLVGYNFLENQQLKVGYSFDYVVKDQDAKKPTSHEVFLRFDLPSLILGGRKAVKTPRFSF